MQTGALKSVIHVGGQPKGRGMVEIHSSDSPERTREIARTFAARLSGGAVVAVFGEMGAGKTCFTQGMALALDIPDVVNSPSFTLINEYRAAKPLYHVDLYRLGSEAEALDLGLDDYTRGSGLLVIEWPERVASWLRDIPHWRVRLEPGASQDERVIRLEACP